MKIMVEGRHLSFYEFLKDNFRWDDDCYYYPEDITKWFGIYLKKNDVFVMDEDEWIRCVELIEEHIDVDDFTDSISYDDTYFDWENY